MSHCILILEALLHKANILLYRYILDGNTGRFISLLATLVLDSLPFTFAPEFLILTTGEMAAPRQTLPKAARRYIYRILFFYIPSVLAIGVICPSNDPALTSGGKGAGASPFVVAIKNAGIPVLDSVINAGILISAWSSGNSFFYMATRSLYSQALAGNAPSWFLACTKGGVPYRCVMAIALFCPLEYLNLGRSSAVVFNWFINFTTNPYSSPGLAAALCTYVSAKLAKLRTSRTCHIHPSYNLGDRTLVFSCSHSLLSSMGLMYSSQRTGAHRRFSQPMWEFRCFWHFILDIGFTIGVTLGCLTLPQWILVLTRLRALLKKCRERLTESGNGGIMSLCYGSKVNFIVLYVV